MAYREPAHVEREVSLTAKRAIMDLYHEFYGVWNVDPEALLGYLERAFSPEGDSSPNHIVRILRMMARNGHRPDALSAAVLALKDEGAFEQIRRRRRGNPYADEVVKSGWGYPAGYRPMPLQGQIGAFARFYPELKIPKAVVEPSRHEQFMPMAVPKLSAVAKRWRIADPFRTGYEDVIRRLADVVQNVFRARRFGFAKTSLDLKGFHRLMPSPTARDAMMRLEHERRDGDILVFPGQLGVRWIGSSMRRIRWHCAHADFEPLPGQREFPLPLYVMLSQLLIHPERLMCSSASGMYCAGDDVVKRGFFGHNGLGLAFGHGVLHLLDWSPSSPDTMFGIPTGLAPK